VCRRILTFANGGPVGTKMTMLMRQERLPISEPLAGLLTGANSSADFAPLRLKGRRLIIVELRSEMNQSELVEKVAQATELNTRLAGQAVQAVVAAILDSLAAGDAVRVSGLGTFNVAARPARDGRNPQSGETIKIPSACSAMPRTRYAAAMSAC